MTKRGKKETLPSTLEEVVNRVEKIGFLRLLIQGAENAAKKAIKELKNGLRDQTEKLKRELMKLEAEVELYAEAHPDQIKRGDRKSILTTAGRIGWRTNPPHLEYAGTDEELETFLLENNLTEYYTTEVKINRKAMLDDPELGKKVPGAKKVSDETFYINTDEKLEDT